MKVPSMMSLTHGATSIMQLRNLERDVYDASKKVHQRQDVVHLEEMSHSGRMEFLKHDGALRKLKQDKERATLAKAEVTRVLERVQYVKQDIAELEYLEYMCNLPHATLSHGLMLHKECIKQRQNVLSRIDDIIASIKTSDLYKGSPNPIEIGKLYNVNVCMHPIKNNFSTSGILAFMKQELETGLSTPSNILVLLDLVITPHLSQDLETCEQADSVIDTEIKMHESILAKFYVSSNEKQLKLADAQVRLDKFLMFLWDQMRWSREMMKMTQGIS